MHRFALAAALAALIATSSGCGLLLGRVKPVDEKAENYQVLDLSKNNPDWSRLEPTAEKSRAEADGEASSSELSDLTFQSKQTSSIVSLNSACRPSNEENNQSLRDFSQLLFLGISDVTQRTEKNLTVAGLPALETTVKGKLGGKPMMLRTVVLRKAQCVYDLMYVARPDLFPTQEPDFSRFVASLKVR